jgi:hypothetical protein
MKLLGLAAVTAIAVTAAMGVATGPAGASVPTVTVSENRAVHPVPARFVGFSIEPANVCEVVKLAQSDPAFVQLFKDMGPGIFRVGGNAGDKSGHWSTTQTASCAWNDNIVTPALVKSFFGFAQSVGYQVMWQVPLLNDNPGPDAAEAAYVSTMPNVYSVEIGNEPSDYPNASTEYQTYIGWWNTVYQDYKADGGTAPVTGPAIQSYKYFYLTPFLNSDASKLIDVTEHYYMGSAGKYQRTCSDLLPVSKQETVTSKDPAYAKTYSLPAIMNETNTYSGQGAQGVSNAFCSALWVADYLLMGLTNGEQGMYVHGTPNYPPGNSWGKLEYYAPINDNGEPAPIYYGMLFYHEVTQAGGTQVPAAIANTTNVEAYAVAGGDGKLRVALVNRNSTPVTVSVQTAASHSQASQVSLTAPALTSQSGVTLGGASVAPDGTWSPSPQPVTVSGTSSAVTVPAYTAMVITYS